MLPAESMDKPIFKSHFGIGGLSDLRVSIMWVIVIEAAAAFMDSCYLSRDGTGGLYGKGMRVVL